MQRHSNMDDRLQKVRRPRHWQEHEETHWPEPEVHEVHPGIQELPRGTWPSLRRYVSVLLRHEHSDHDLQERTTSLCCERRVLVEYVDPLWPTSTLRFLVAPVWPRSLRKYVRRELFGMQQTVTQSLSSTLWTGPGQVFTTCRSEPWPADTGTSPTLAPSESSSWQAQIWTPFPRFLASRKINGRNHCELKFVRHRHGRSFHGFELFTWHVRDVRALGLLQKTLTTRVRLSSRSAGLYVIAYCPRACRGRRLGLVLNGTNKSSCPDAARSFIK